MKSRTNAFLTLAAAILVAFVMFPAPASADHSWGSYHWARTSNPFTVNLGDNVSNTAYSNWEAALGAAATDWSQSSVLDSPLTAGQAGNPKRCAAKSGRIEVCNATYGFNGWLGLASIRISGVHITSATAKMNDSYFNSTRYSYTNERHVMCQEVGHGYGLGHTSEDGSDQNTCMDYSNDLGNPSPNAHDYEQLETIYAHIDSTSTTSGFARSETNPFMDDDASHNWGRLVWQSPNGRSSYYEGHDQRGNRKITHVFWTEEAAERCRACDHRYHDH